MVSFRKKLIESEIPASLPAVVKKLIPPKGIKRKNQEGYELLDFICPDDAQEDDYQNLFDNLFKSQINVEEESDGESSGSDDSSDEVLQDEGTATEPDESEIAASSSRVVSLSNLCDDSDVNKDALFLDSMAKVFEMDTSEIFFSRVRKFQSVFDEACRSVKKRIESKLSTWGTLLSVIVDYSFCSLIPSTCVWPSTCIFNPPRLFISNKISTHLVYSIHPVYLLWAKFSPTPFIPDTRVRS